MTTAPVTPAASLLGILRPPLRNRRAGAKVSPAGRSRCLRSSRRWWPRWPFSSGPPPRVARPAAAGRDRVVAARLSGCGVAFPLRRRAMAAILIVFVGDFLLISRFGFAAGLSVLVVVTSVLGIIVGGRPRRIPHDWSGCCRVCRDWAVGRQKKISALRAGGRSVPPPKLVASGGGDRVAVGASRAGDRFRRSVTSKPTRARRRPR